MNRDFSYITYGSRSTAEDIRNFLLHVFRSNAQPVPVCIWGAHGIGKTELVEQVAFENGFDFRYISPAQFEEMGDLVGMPRIADSDGSFVTEFAPPEWVPREAGPGILLIDDVNRADDRILRGIMQLLQKQELVSWKLPEGWQIVLTANPDGGDYSVTPMDFAMVTRMLHVTMEFDVQVWARWAEKKNIDPRGISFVLSYPEIVTGDRTTPRTLVQFFNQIKSLPEIEKESSLVKMLGDACLDPETVQAFLNFSRNKLGFLVHPDVILNTTDFEKEVDVPIRKVVTGDIIRVDILSVISNRLINHILTKNIQLDKVQKDNLVQFLLMDFFPNDLRFSIGQEMMRSENKGLMSLWQHPELGKILIRNLF